MMGAARLTILSRPTSVAATAERSRGNLQHQRVVPPMSSDMTVVSDGAVPETRVPSFPRSWISGCSSAQNRCRPARCWKAGYGLVRGRSNNAVRDRAQRPRFPLGPHRVAR